MGGEDNDTASSPKITGIRQLVRLREMLKKWHLITLGHRPTSDPVASPSTTAIPPAVNKRICRDLSAAAVEEGNYCTSPAEPHVDVPKGYIPVYVGGENRRFVIPMTYLGLPVFKLLLEKAGEEFGFDQQGALTIPCEIETFKYILAVMERHQKGAT